MTLDITQIIVAVIGLLAAIVTAKVLPYVKSRLGQSNYETLETIVGIAVYAAEQLIGPGKGEEKLSYALLVVQKELAARNILFDSETVRAAIESEVLTLPESTE